jgi:hypothetical protein
MRMISVLMEYLVTTSLPHGYDGPAVYIFAPHALLNTTGRFALNSGGGLRCDVGQMGGRWFQLEGSGGDALATTEVGTDHCGSQRTGWLTGWEDPSSAPARNFGSFGTGVGSYPGVETGVVERTVCWHNGGGHDTPCEGGSSSIAVVNCGSHFLWRLEDPPACPNAYCTVPSNAFGR